MWHEFSPGGRQKFAAGCWEHTHQLLQGFELKSEQRENESKNVVNMIQMLHTNRAALSAHQEKKMDK